jgi:quercetin dioxygenase-like cupin family protein
VAERGRITGVDPLNVAGSDDAAEMVERARSSYANSLYTAEPPLWPDGGVRKFQPVLDGVLGDNHLVRVRLESGARSARHTHDSDQVMVVVEGAGTLETDDSVIELGPGSVVFTPSGVPHIHTANSHEDVEYVYFTATGHDTVVEDVGSRA